VAKLFVIGLALAVAGAAYWYFKGSRSGDVHDYADSARDRASDVFDSASEMASNAASRVSDQFDRVADRVRS
jgi:hypothetical protein